MFYAAQPQPQQDQDDHNNNNHTQQMSLGAAAPTPTQVAEPPHQSTEDDRKLKNESPQEQKAADQTPKNSNTGAMPPASEPERRYRPQKYCSVCGDKAIACNFNAVTCESCKAFFRRNAFKEQKLKCLFDNRCEISRVTRRFCSKCRLIKCFQIGMKREWILTDEQKRIKKVKILQNKQVKQQRLSSTDGYSDDFSPAKLEMAETTKFEPDYRQDTLQARSQSDQHPADKPTSTNQKVGASKSGSKKQVEMRDASTSCPDEFDLQPMLENDSNNHNRNMIFNNNFCSFASHCQYCSMQVSANLMRPTNHPQRLLASQDYINNTRQSIIPDHRATCDQSQANDYCPPPLSSMRASHNLMSPVGPAPPPPSQPHQPQRVVQQHQSGPPPPPQPAPPCCCGNPHYATDQRQSTGQSTKQLMSGGGGGESCLQTGSGALHHQHPHLHNMNPPQMQYNSHLCTGPCLNQNMADVYGSQSGGSGNSSSNNNSTNSNNNNTSAASQSSQDNNLYTQQSRNPFVMALDVRPLHSLYGNLKPTGVSNAPAPSANQSSNCTNSNSTNSNTTSNQSEAGANPNRSQNSSSNCEVSTTNLSDNSDQICMDTTQIVMNESLSIY